MRDADFEWDDVKAARNAIKHGVSFDMAREAFDDVNSIEEADPDPDEDRWQLTGRTRSGLLIVIYVERGPLIRIISARKATAHEQARYIRQARP